MNEMLNDRVNEYEILYLLEVDGPLYMHEMLFLKINPDKGTCTQNHGAAICILRV